MIKYTTANFSDRTINIVTGLLMALTSLAAPLATAGKDVDVDVLGYRTNAACLQFMVLLIPVREPLALSGTWGWSSQQAAARCHASAHNGRMGWAAGAPSCCLQSRQATAYMYLGQ